MQQQPNNIKTKSVRLAICVVLIVAIQCIVRLDGSVEHWFSSGLYPYVSGSLRVCFGWLPFSIGDLFYSCLILFFIVKTMRFLKQLFSRKMTWKRFVGRLFRVVVICCSLYVVFYSFWGLNYYRKGIAYQLKMEKQPYSTAELSQLTKELALKASDYRKKVSPNQYKLDKSELFQKAKQAYDSVEKIYPFLQFKHKSTKASLFGGVGNYLGYTGYYNPFSGEAQVNMQTPPIVLPSVVCHEMAHQLGYATEDEANFVGYLAASHSQDNVFLYAIYLDLYEYAASELYVRDSVQYNATRQSLDTLVRKDIRDIRLFYLTYRTKMRNVTNAIYGQYLKANNQPQGIDTYSDVVSLLIAYRKKYGLI